MKVTLTATVATATLSIAASAVDGHDFAYPPAFRGDQVDQLHGVIVSDPYRWMEDIDSPQTRAWVRAESRLCAEHLAGIPGRDAIARRLKGFYDFERWGAPERHGRYWFYTHNQGLQNQPVVFVTDDLGKPGHVLLDPNTLASDGAVALNERAISRDGRLFAYALSEAGSDWQTWHVRNVATGKDLPDELHWSKAGGGSWRTDGSGFYYTAFAAPQSAQVLKAANQYQQLRFHRLGSAQSQDPVVYSRTDDPDWYLNGTVTEDGHYLVVQATHGDAERNTLLVQDLTAPGRALMPVIASPIASYRSIGSVGSTLYVLTDDAAPHYRVVAIDLTDPERSRWRTAVPERPDTLMAVSIVGSQLIAQYSKDAHSAVSRFSLDGKFLGELKLAGLGTVAGFQGHVADRSVYYSYSGYTIPPVVFRLDLQSGQSTLWRQSKVRGFAADAYETREVFYPSRDGTRIPLYIIARRGLKLDGTNPTLLYGYGGYNISIEPAFYPNIAQWAASGGMYAFANLRGGGEYGRAWHEAGMKTHKQTVFDDFTAAARYLIAEKWTSPQRLAIRGTSNGGLLIGVTLEQHPELFAAAVPQVGVMDMLRFREFTVGKAWEEEFGSIDDPVEFRYLLGYSPLHNVRSGVRYPAVLVTTGDHDDRVFPAHSFKFTAAMQYANPDGKPILIRIGPRAGHGQGKPVEKQIAESADIHAFILEAMGLSS